MDTQTEVKAQGHRGWYRVSRDISAALCATKLTGCQAAIIQAVMLYSYGLNPAQKESELTFRTLPRVLPYDASTIREARDALLAKAIIGETADRRYFVNPHVTQWNGIERTTFDAARAPFARMQDAPEGAHPAHERTNARQNADTPPRRKGYTHAPEGARPVEGAVLETERDTQQHHHTATGAKTAGMIGDSSGYAASPHGEQSASPLGHGAGKPKTSVNPLVAHNAARNDPNAWIIKSLIGYCIRQGDDDDDAIRMITPLAERIYKRGDTIDPEKFCDVVYAVRRALYQGTPVRNPAGAVIDGYERDSWKPVGADKGKLFRILKGRRDGGGS